MRLFSGTVFYGYLLIFQRLLPDKRVILTKTDCGLKYKQLDKIAAAMCKMEERHQLNEDEQTALDISIQCITEIMNRMRDNKPIEFEVV